MSIRVMSYVWEHSKAAGTKLLLMLALADRANDDGECWPGVKSLSAKCRCTERNVQYLLEELVNDGEVEIAYQGSKLTTNIYKIVIGGVKPTSPGGETHFTGGVKPTSPNTSLIKEEEEEETRPEIYSIYERECGPLTPFIANTLTDLVEEHTLAWTEKAIIEASTNGKRNLAYVKAILSRWKAEGYGVDNRKKGSGKGATTKTFDPSEMKR